MSACIRNILDKYDGAERIDGGKDYDIVLLPGFAAKLGKEPAEWQQELVQKYPVCGAGDAIVPGRVQWVSGENAALKYRGNALKRAKIWLQRGEPRQEGYWYYYYTGIQWAVIPAQTGWLKCAEVGSVIPALDAFYTEVGAALPNQAIVTRYRDGSHFIGKHSDKHRSIVSSREGAESLITVVKMGEVGRTFNLYHKGGEGGEDELFWSNVIAPGDAIVMTVEANLLTKHEVPEGGVDGDSGSIVFRTLNSCRPAAEVAKKIAASEKTKAREKAKKRQRESE